MSQQHPSCVHTLACVLAFLRAHPGQSFPVEEICQQTDCTPRQVQLALNVLVREDVILKEGAVGEAPRYGWG
jgi:hypothetical protein